MHKITFHNLGNADCIRLKLSNNRRVLFDYADCRDPKNAVDRRCDLPKTLREELGKQDYYDVVAFTHLDRDHYQGATNFFYFEHVKEYQQSVGGKTRIKMKVLWVPAAVITENLGGDANDEAKAIQKEARERFKASSGVRVFSRSERLRAWCDKNNIDLDKRLDIITDAGSLAPEFTMANDKAEFFVHSPFAMKQDDKTIEDRNNDALVMHVTLKHGTKARGVFLSSDVSDVILSEIVQATERNKNSSRLEWDIFKISHHCSYKALNSEEKGVDKTRPISNVKRLLEDYSRKNCIVVSSSDTIPQKGDDRDTEKSPNPPHRQAANYYKEDVVADSKNDFQVTMEQPSRSNPKPISIEIDQHITIKKAVASFAPAVSTRAPRAG